jgi:hypothetical protein
MMPKRNAGELIVGVTGHRRLVDTERIVRDVEEAFNRIRAAYHPEQLTLLSPLAEGADRLVVKLALQSPEVRLIALLPLPEDDYIKDFDEPESRRAFKDMLQQADDVITMPPCAGRDQAYMNTGRYIVEHCDVLLAIWNGKAARGVGGTGDIVQLARERGTPLAWILASNGNASEHAHPKVGQHDGNVQLERFPTRT